jgi:hypothetical protein
MRSGTSDLTVVIPLKTEKLPNGRQPGSNPQTGFWGMGPGHVPPTMALEKYGDRVPLLGDRCSSLWNPMKSDLTSSLELPTLINIRAGHGDSGVSWQQ